MPAHRGHRGCVNKLQHLSSASTDGVWITDVFLASAFDRYCQVSWAARRRVSSVPGPLESRRRLGKRQMGYAGQLHPSLPSWAFQYPADLTLWHWEPPTPATLRTQKPPAGDPSSVSTDQTSTSWIQSLSLKFPTWWRSGPDNCSTTTQLMPDATRADEPEPEPIPDAIFSFAAQEAEKQDLSPDIEEVAAPEARLDSQTEPVQDTIYSFVAQEAEKQDWSPGKAEAAPPDGSGLLDSLLSDIRALADHPSPQQRPESHVLSDLDKICATLSNHISQGWFRPREILTALDTIEQAMSHALTRVHGNRATDDALFQLYWGVADALSRSPGMAVKYRNPNKNQNLVVWRALLERITMRIHANPRFCNLFELILFEVGNARALRLLYFRMAEMTIRKVVSTWMAHSDVKGSLEARQYVAATATEVALGGMHLVATRLGALDAAITAGHVDRAMELAGAAARALKTCDKALSLIPGGERLLATSQYWRLLRATAPLAGALTSPAASSNFGAWALPETTISSVATASSRHQPIVDVRKQHNHALLKEAANVVAKESVRWGYPLSVQHRVRYAWMFTLSQIPAVRQSLFFSQLKSMYDEQDAPDIRKLFSNKALCLLLLERWHSRGHLNRTQHNRMLEGLTRQNEYHSLGYLVSASYYTLSRGLKKKWSFRLRHALYKQVWQSLECLGRADELGPSIEAFMFAGVGPQADWSFLRALADVCPDERLARDTLGLARGPELEDKFEAELPVMVADPERHPNDAFQIMGLPLVRPNRRYLRQLVRRRHISPRQVSLVVRSSVAMSKAGHLSVRQMFRHLSQCGFLLRRHRAEQTVPIMALTQAVIRALASGKRMPVSRLRWLLRTIQNNSGPEATAKCREAIILWMEWSSRQLRMRQVSRRMNSWK